MSKIKNILTIVIAIAVLSVAVFAVSKITKMVQIAEDVTLEDVKDCHTVYWNETEDIIGVCAHSYNVTACDDEPFNTSCSVEEISYNYSCKTDSNLVEKSKEVCKDKEFQLTVDKLIDEKYKLQYGDWGKCSYTAGNQTAEILCDSRLDGNNDGICQPGESCIKFIVSKDNIQALYRNSRDDFVENDETFRQEELSLEVI